MISPASPPPATPPPPGPPPSISLDSLLSKLPFRLEPQPADAYVGDAQGQLYRVESLDDVVPAALQVVIDPTSAEHRMVLACSLAQHGQHEAAGYVVRQLLAQADCSACRDAVQNVSASACEFDAATRALAAPLRPSPKRAAALAILHAFDSGDTTPIERYIDGDAMTFDFGCSVCEEDDPERVHRYGPARFRQLLREVGAADESEGYDAPLLLFCVDDCCSGPPARVNHSSTTVLGLCFRGAPDAPKLDGMSTTAG